MTDRPIDPSSNGGYDRNWRATFKPIEHQVSTAPFDPNTVEQMTAAQERYYMASQWKMVWWRFRKHRIAVISGAFLLLCYLSIFISEMIAPYGLLSKNTQFIYAPPQSVHLFHEGAFIGPFVYGYTFTLNMENLKREYAPDPDRIERLRFFCFGDKYRETSSHPEIVDGTPENRPEMACFLPTNRKHEYDHPHRRLFGR